MTKEEIIGRLDEIQEKSRLSQRTKNHLRKMHKERLMLYDQGISKNRTEYYQDVTINFHYIYSDLVRSKSRTALVIDNINLLGVSKVRMSDVLNNIKTFISDYASNLIMIKNPRQNDNMLMFVNGIKVSEFIYMLLNELGFVSAKDYYKMDNSKSSAFYVEWFVYEPNKIIYEYDKESITIGNRVDSGRNIFGDVVFMAGILIPIIWYYPESKFAYNPLLYAFKDINNPFSIIQNIIYYATGGKLDDFVLSYQCDENSGVEVLRNMISKNSKVGKPYNPKLSTVNKLANCIGVPVSVLIETENYEEHVQKLLTSFAKLPKYDMEIKDRVIARFDEIVMEELFGDRELDDKEN